MTVPQLSVRGVSKTFPGTRALKNVDLDVQPGHVHALVGANGSGKSTLIKILAGVHEPDPGSSAQVRGEDFELGSVTAADRAGLRFVHQDTGLVHSLDAADNIALGRSFETDRMGRIRWREQRRAARAALESLGYSIDVRRPVGELRPSERTGIAIARSLQGWEEGASVLVLDEPTASLPRPEVDALFEVVSRVRDLGVSVIYISHHLDEVFAVADRVSVLRDGTMIGTHDVADIDHGELVHMMVGEVVDRPATHREAASGEPVLELSSVSAKVLDDFDLRVRRGEIVGIAGITGSGRDEVAPLVFGARERRGTVEVAGSPIPQQRPDLAVAAGVGLVPANRHTEGVVLEMSVLENLTMADLRPYWSGLRFRRKQERVDGEEWVRRLSVKPQRVDPLVSTLSGGNQQKVVIGKWLRTDPSVLLLDEPTQGVDVRSKAEIHQLVDEAAAAGTAVLVCSSDEAELERLCHRVLVLERGRVVAELTGDDIVAAKITRLSLGADHTTVASGPAHSGGTSS